MKPIFNNALTSLAGVLILLNSCDSKEMQKDANITHNPNLDSVVWAVNIGGDAYDSTDGIHYAADEFITGGEVSQMEAVVGSQDNELYQSYRIGNLKVSKAIPNGTYDLQFRFSEPSDIPVGDRVFNVLAQGKTVIKDLDVRLARDGRHVSALDRAVTGVVVTDGKLNITFQALAGEPVLNALVVRQQMKDPRKWNLVWSDEFDQDGPPNDARWTADIWPARKVNDEEQAYTNRSKNVRIENGHLILEAHREDYDNASYTSGRVHSKGKGDFLYGKIDVRAKLPAGQGSWPAIWMLPSDPYKYSTSCGEDEDWQGSATCDAWPNSGEIDIMEHVGYDMHNVHGTVHNKAAYWIHWNQRKGSIEGKTVDKEFHVYSLEWSPEELTVSMDGSPYFTYVNEGTGWEAWPYDHPFHLVLNLAVGGMWGRAGGPVDNTIFPMRLEIDYVRVYEEK